MPPIFYLYTVLFAFAILAVARLHRFTTKHIPAFEYYLSTLDIQMLEEIARREPISKRRLFQLLDIPVYDDCFNMMLGHHVERGLVECVILAPGMKPRFCINTAGRIALVRYQWAQFRA